jgi:hypothetical protein
LISSALAWAATLGLLAVWFPNPIGWDGLGVVPTLATEAMVGICTGYVLTRLLVPAQAAPQATRQVARQAIR